jgi:hypothetical protein
MKESTVDVPFFDGYNLPRRVVTVMGQRYALKNYVSIYSFTNFSRRKDSGRCSIDSLAQSNPISLLSSPLQPILSA